MNPTPSLLPCPFCGHVPEVWSQPDAGFYVACENTDCPVWSVETQSVHTKEAAAEAWNTRAPIPS